MQNACNPCRSLACLAWDHFVHLEFRFTLALFISQSPRRSNLTHTFVIRNDKTDPSNPSKILSLLSLHQQRSQGVPSTCCKIPEFVGFQAAVDGKFRDASANTCQDTPARNASVNLGAMLICQKKQRSRKDMAVLIAWGRDRDEVRERKHTSHFLQEQSPTQFPLHLH